MHGSDSSASQEPAWHAQTAAEVLGALKSSPNGLTIAEVRKRLNQYGPNQIAEAPLPNPLAIVAHQFASPLMVTLALAALAAGLLGEWLDAAVIVAALVINALFGFLQEWRAESAIRSLLRYLAPKARVLRDGREQIVDSKELAPGDIVLLESGVRVPADLRLLATTALLIDESVLTGESAPVAKRPDPVAADTPVADRTCMAYLGTVVTSGRGRGIVVATGSRTEVGRVAAIAQQEVAPLPPCSSTSRALRGRWPCSCCWGSSALEPSASSVVTSSEQFSSSPLARRLRLSPKIFRLFSRSFSPSASSTWHAGTQSSGISRPLRHLGVRR